MIKATHNAGGQPPRPALPGQCRIGMGGYPRSFTGQISLSKRLAVEYDAKENMLIFSPSIPRKGGENA
jgi:hypothetical protein